MADSYSVTTGRGIQLERAYFCKQGATDKIGVLFNPAEVSVNKAVGWNYQAQPGKNTGSLQYSAGQPRTISLKLDFDTSGLDNASETPDAQDVRLAIDPIYALTNIPDDAKDKKKARPPYVDFAWGNGLKFTCVIKSLNTTFTKFNPDGVPIRANVSVELMEVVPPGTQGSGGAAQTGTLQTTSSNSTAASVSGRTSKEQQEQWRTTMKNNPDAFPDGNARKSSPGQPVVQQQS